MSPPPPSSRRHLPEPLETTARSSRPAARDSSDTPSSQLESSGVDNNRSMSAQTKPRKFLPQPVEESTRSSRKKIVDHVEDSTVRGNSSDDSITPSHYSYSDDPTLPGVPNSRPPSTSRRFAPEPVETSSRSRRKFAPEPVEVSTRSSKDKRNSKEEDSATKPRRKFAPEPVETTARSSKDKPKQDDDASQTSRPRRRFAPEPIETTVTTSRRRNPASEGTDDEPPKTADSRTSSRTSTETRKFSPELLETAKGSYRRVHPVHSEAKSPRLPPPETQAPLEEAEAEDQVTGLEESRFSAAALARKHPEVTRQHSFIVPDLPVVESASEDETSEAPSLSDSPSSVDSEINKNTKKLAAKDSYTEYVLRLAAETVTEKELQEQAMAAYINERPHEPVDHFAASRDEDDDDGPLPVPMFQGEGGVDVRTFRRSSAAELDLELANMRKHHEQLEAAKRELKADTAGHSRFSAAALATRHALEAKGVVKKVKKFKGEDEDSELARMRAAASPPMQGKDLIFPFTISPKMTRCDPDQPPRPRNADSDDDEATDVDATPLWKVEKKPENNAETGLWMGMCQAGMWQPRSPQNGLRSGIQTPSPVTPIGERPNPFESTTPGRGHQTPGRRRAFNGLNYLPLTPPRSQDGEDVFTSTIDKKLQLEKQIEEEFPSRVVTQIYNYLSLGYPSLAHMFDEELSKISRIPLEELRRDDKNVDAKGYVGAPEGDGWEEGEVISKCKRWEALRLYVKEWARQSPNFAEERRRACLGANEDWGARVRRGSWAH